MGLPAIQYTLEKLQANLSQAGSVNELNTGADSSSSLDTQKDAIIHMHFKHASKCIAVLKQDHSKQAFIEAKKALQICVDSYPTNHEGKIIVERCIKEMNAIEFRNQKAFWNIAESRVKNNFYAENQKYFPDSLILPFSQSTYANLGDCKGICAGFGIGTLEEIFHKQTLCGHPINALNDPIFLPILSRSKYFEMDKHNQTIDLLNQSFWYLQGNVLGIHLSKENQFSDYHYYNSKYHFGNPLLEEKITENVTQTLIEKLRTESSKQYFHLGFDEGFDIGHATSIYLDKERVLFIDANFGIFKFSTINQFANWFQWFLDASCYSREYRSLELLSLDFEKRDTQVAYEKAMKTILSFQNTMIYAQENKFLIQFQQEVFPHLKVLQKTISLDKDPIDLYNQAELLIKDYIECLEALRKSVPERIATLEKIEADIDRFTWNNKRSLVTSALFNYKQLQNDLSKDNFVIDLVKLGETYWYFKGIEALKNLLRSEKELVSVLSSIILEDHALLSKMITMQITNDKYKQELSQTTSNLLTFLVSTHLNELNKYNQTVLEAKNKHSSSDSYTAFLKSSMLKTVSLINTRFKETIQYWNYEKNFDDDAFISSYNNSLKNHCIKHLKEADNNKRIQELDLDYAQLKKNYQPEVTHAADGRLIESIEKELGVESGTFKIEVQKDVNTDKSTTPHWIDMIEGIV
jgi:hypothetical protein